MATIYLIRHGQASFGSDNYDQLSELGCKQADVLGEYFATCNIHFDSAYSGTLSRQKQTAEIALKSQPTPLPLQTDKRFNELNNDEQFEYLLPVVTQKFPEISDLSVLAKNDSKSYQKVLEQVFNYWVSDECNEPNIQSWNNYSSMTMNAIQELTQQEGSGKKIAVLTSGGTIATIVSQVLGLDGSFAYRFYEPIVNASITQLLYNDTKISLSNFNDYSYLEWDIRANKQTSSNLQIKQQKLSSSSDVFYATMVYLDTLKNHLSELINTN